MSEIQIERRTLSLADQAADITRKDIIRGQLRPGARLSERTLAARLSISQAPAREALLQLEREGLVVTQTGGRYVVELTASEVLELTEIRMPLEKLAALWAAKRKTPEVATVLQASLERMRQAVAAKDDQAIITIDREIHRTIWAGSGSRRLVGILDTLIGPLWMFFHTQVDTSEGNRAYWDGLMANHESLVQAILSGDPAAIEMSVERHTEDSLRRALSG